jgi:hypothetical protein
MRRSVTAASCVAVVVLLAVAIVALPLASAQGRPFDITLSGAEEVDPPNPHGDDDRGSVRLTINVGQRTVCWQFGELTLTEGDALPHMSHIHEAPRGVAGGIVLTLFGMPENTNADNTPPAPTSYPTGTVCVEGVERSLLVDISRSPQNYYVNMHNTQHPTGVVRGQLR